MMTRRILAVKHPACGLIELAVERSGLVFEPGDCLALFNADGESRPYSIQSGTHDSELRFLIRHIPGGAVSGWLASRQPGETLAISHPFGWFRPAQAAEETGARVFVATGTGIAPFLSALRSAPGLSPALLLCGVRKLEDAVALDYLQQRCPTRLAVSREYAPPHHHGRVTDLLDTLPLAAGTRYYLCGLDAMIDAVTRWLEEHGVPFTHIHREVFFNA